MSDRFFVDTNILVYTFASSEPEKQARAQKVVASALRGDGLISFQVVQEFLNVSTRKFEASFSPRDRGDYVDGVLEPLCEVFPTLRLYREALDIHERWQLAFYDALIVSAALTAECAILYTEDLQHALKIRTLTVVNPFCDP